MTQTDNTFKTLKVSNHKPYILWRTIYYYTEGE